MHDALIGTLSALVAFRTTAESRGPKQECLDFIDAGFLRSAGLPIRRGDVKGSPYLFLEHPAPKLLWFAHIDVVPAPEHMFSVRREGDTLYGRGVKDMKGAITPFLHAYRAACEAGKIPPVSVLLSSDEEVGGTTIPVLLEQGMLRCPAAFTPDTGSDTCIVVQHKGAVWARLHAHGKGGHGAMPCKAKNPVLLLAQAIAALDKAFPPGIPSDWRVTVTPTELFGSSAQNVIPATVSATLDIRYPTEIAASAADAIALVAKHLPEGCTLTEHVAAHPLATPPDHPLVLLMQRIAQEVMGEKVAIGRTHGASDARNFWKAGIPAFLYGPLGGELHADGEWVSLPSLAQHVEVNARFLDRLLSV